jgi:predicted transcriptional regulator
MNSLPCEKAIWETIPMIRKEMACCMVRDFGLIQKEAAILIGITPAAVSQYRCNKRAKKEIKNPTILKEIKISVERIVVKDNSVLNSEICRLCKLINNIDPCPG